MTWKPKAWNNGNAAITTSSSPTWWTGRVWQRLATRLRCVSTTLFGRPDVPLDHGRNATSAEPTRTAGTSAFISDRREANGIAPVGDRSAAPRTKVWRTPAATAHRRTFSSNSSTLVTSQRALAWRSKCVISSPWKAGFRVVRVAPTVDAAYHATTNSMLLGAHNATTSPGCTP